VTAPERAEVRETEGVFVLPGGRKADTQIASCAQGIFFEQRSLKRVSINPTEISGAGPYVHLIDIILVGRLP